MAKPWLRSLDEIEGPDLPLVGGKAFRLATLKQNGFNVPQGLILTTAFFEAQLEYCQLVPLWAGSPDVAVTTESLNWLANTLKIKPLAKELLAALNTHLETTFGQGIDSFAVRSSAIDEDQREHTFAGVHLTELGVPRSVLPIAITRCWASALDEPAIKYRQTHGMSIQNIRIAVLIQPMLNPVSAGVGFSLNPLTGSRNELIIEATWGLGETVVSGEIQPYFYKLANQPPDYPVLEQRASNITPPPEMAEQAETGPLPVTALAELAIQIKQIQALMGEAQDVEWARQEDSFFFLQTRPVALPPQPEQMIDREWTRGNHPEFLPELPSPLCGTLLERTQPRAITFFKELGLQIEGLGPYLKLILGRPYLNLTLLKRVISQLGANPGHVLHTIGQTEPGVMRGNLAIDWETVWRMRGVYWRVLKRLLRAGPALKHYQGLVDEVTAVLDGANMEAPLTSLLAQLRQQEQLYSELFHLNLNLASGISVLTTLGSSLIAPLAKTPGTLLSSLAMQGVQTRDSRLNQDLLKLAHLARRDKQVQTYFSHAPDDFHDYPDNPAIPAEFKESFAELLARYGHWATYETDMGWPRYGDDPASLLRIVRQYSQIEHLAGPKETAGPPTDRAEISWANSSQATGINRLLPWRRWLAGLVVRFLRRLLVMRDESNSARARAMAACRRWDLVLGQKWVKQGWLVQPEDIFWLTLEEVERMLMVEATMGITLSSTVQARKETYQTYAETEMPFNLQESEIPYIQLGIGLSPEAASEVMMGLPVSPGQARGTVLVLHSPDEFEQLAEEIILVMPSTDPAWLPLLHLASGLIVEMGGLLSHGSVIAREYGLPAVANIPQATKRFRTGDVVLVDGSTGVIQFLESGGISMTSLRRGSI